MELLGRYSNWTYWTEPIAALPVVSRSGTNATPCKRRVLRKLSGDEVADLMQRYPDDTGTYALAERFGVHRVTVTVHLRRHGVRLRGRSMAEDEVGKAPPCTRKVGR